MTIEVVAIASPVALILACAIAALVIAAIIAAFFRPDAAERLEALIRAWRRPDD